MRYLEKSGQKHKLMQAKIDKDKKLILEITKQVEAKQNMIKVLEKGVKKSTVSLKKMRKDTSKK